MVRTHTFCLSVLLPAAELPSQMGSPHKVVKIASGRPCFSWLAGRGHLIPLSASQSEKG